MFNIKYNDELTVAYVFIIEQMNQDNNKYNVIYKEPINDDEKYIYNIDLSNSIIETQNINELENYIQNNNVIVYCINNDINKFLYSNLIDKEYNDINDLNIDLQTVNINYEEINNIVEQNIQNAINNILEILNNKFGQNNQINIYSYYFYLTYNKYTYYPQEYIDQIINRIKEKINYDNSII